MYWVVQHDLFHDNQRQAVLETLRRFDIPHQAVSVTSDYGLVPEVAPEGPVITNGSVMLSSIAVRRGWKPGSLMNENFSYEVWHPHFREHLLNRDAVFTTLREADPSLPEFFVRPLLDDKSFNGRVTTREAFRGWQADVLAGRDRSVSPDTRILYAPAKRIGQEHRHYVVDGKIVSSSRYKLGGQMNQSPEVDGRVLDFAREMVRGWNPARAFVLDTYLAGDEVGVVEMGCICNAGLYQADVQKIVMALDAMPT